jgi:hypothetical protein
LFLIRTTPMKRQSAISVACPHSVAQVRGPFKFVSRPKPYVTGAKV